MSPSIKWVCLCAVVAGCHQAGTGRAVTNRASIKGTILTEGGQGAAGPTLIGVTDQKTGFRWGVASAGRDGHFDIPLPAGEYALAVLSDVGFAYVEHVRSPAVGFAIILSRSCVLREGHVRGASAPGAVAEFSRYSDFIGDRFVAPIGPDGGFRGCLPQAEYRVWAGGSLVSQTVRVLIAKTTAIELATYARGAIETPPPVAPAARFSLADLAATLRKGPRVLGFGEANHGTGDFYTQRGALALELARTAGLRYIMLEADAVGLLRVDDYVQGDPVDLSAALAALGFWVTDHEELIAVIEQLRAFNAGMPPERRLHVLGFDAQMTEPAAKLLVGAREELGLTQQQADLLTRLGPDNAKSFRNMTEAEQANVQNLLGRLSEGRRFDARATSGRAAIAARSLRHQIGYLSELSGGTRQSEMRDAAMADIATFVVERGGPGRASLWAHAAHIAREIDGGMETMGLYLGRHFGSDYYPIGFFSYAGAARAWDASGEIGVIPYRLAPTPPYYMESAIMEATGHASIAWVAMKTMPAALHRWLESPRYSREFGAIYTGEEDARTLRLFPVAFDALVVLKHGSPSTPTLTGVRRVTR
jgi:erythromycin esterase